MSSCEAGAKRPRSISNLWGLCQTRKTPTLADNNNQNVFRRSIWDTLKKRYEISHLFQFNSGQLLKKRCHHATCFWKRVLVIFCLLVINSCRTMESVFTIVPEFGGLRIALTCGVIVFSKCVCSTILKFLAAALKHMWIQNNRFFTRAEEQCVLSRLKA
jgi:hypothetical protein